MSREHLLHHLERLNYAITPEEILACNLAALIDQGLRVVTLCFDGSGRSYTVAQKLSSKYEIPAVRVKGGIKRLTQDAELSQSLIHITSILNTIPTMAVILTPQEVSMQMSVLSQLRALIYPNSDSAIRSIELMEH